ncbi:uncharacterized protein FPRO_15161 [Fusarium proliferatum ET1]|uniref:2EXR domain-containing protein n=1 Tax=Fusarium proliferatum (strain ET1) TaxID=1227346 RepID=A0A1L7VZ24_FUSPR|nr:uncharacterized protein FPRO_15161 [Fusarium proliferatum ET1]CZR45663.1 uncharacterized protein FPRO_15161 [Fusarium proliferatum ET1]
MTQPMVVEDPDHGVGLKQMKEMPTLSAEEIPPTTFHSFPNLATELRLKIWKAACFPYAATKRGLHYINLESIGGNEISGELITQMTAMEMKALHPDFQTSSNLQGVVGRANRSAYMWDAGLWKACRESREFISRHFKLNIWGYIQEKDLDLLDLDECLSKACQLYPWKPRYEELEERPGLESSARKPEPFLPTCLFSRNQEHAERFMVMPNRDLFCIKSLDRGDLPVTMQAPRLHVPCPNSQEIVLLHSFNLVLEFNTSWLDAFPKSWNKLKEEESSRGLFATWAEGCMRGRGNAPYIYLLNKAARWGPHWWVKDDMTSLS